MLTFSVKTLWMVIYLIVGPNICHVSADMYRSNGELSGSLSIKYNVMGRMIVNIKTKMGLKLNILYRIYNVHVTDSWCAKTYSFRIYAAHRQGVI